MASTVSVIGLNPDELPWLHSLVWLLRHPDPVVAELTRQTILHLEGLACGEKASADRRQNGA